jgi:hypothetical protein
MPHTTTIHIVQTGEEPQGYVLFLNKREAWVFDAADHPAEVGETHLAGEQFVRPDWIRPSKTHPNGFRFTDDYFTYSA